MRHIRIFVVVALGLVLSVLSLGTAQAANETVKVNGQTVALSGINTYRSANFLVLYNPDFGARTGTNAYGYEVVVVNKKVTQVQDGVGNIAIPANGVVLSGHGTMKTWLKTNATVGAPVVLPGDTTPSNDEQVKIGTATFAVAGVNIARGSNQLIDYTPAFGATTKTNAYGAEAVVVNGKVTKIENGVGNIAIPAGGYVLSGHGTAKTWLVANAKVGATVILGDVNTGPGDKPAIVTETRVQDGTPKCETLTVPINNQARTHDWVQTDGQWVAGAWSAWSTTSTGTRAASAKDCVNLGSKPSDALMPDVRIRNLDKCGSGDMAATDGKCVLIVPSAPYNASFPSLQGKKLLKFPVITMNVGAGPLEMIADRSAASASDWKAYQTYYRPNGERVSVAAPEVEFYYAGDGHNHWHVRDFDEYDILDASGAVLRTAEKHGYCMQDNTSYSPLQGQSGVPSSPVYLESTSCGKGLPNTLTIIHGLSKGWGDTYPTSLPDQAIDITGLPNGTYTVRIHADAVGAIAESSESNNTASMKVTINGNTVTPVAGSATGGI